MNNFHFERFRQCYIEKNVTALKKEVTILMNFLLSTSYIKNNAFYHPLGFIYSKLFEFDNKETIRIHIWNKKYYSINPIMGIHNHYYVVNSYLYKGCLNNNVFRINETESNNYSIYEGAYNHNGDRILKKSSKGVNLSLDHTEFYCGGDLYQIPINTIHSGYPINDNPVCTIVYTEKPGNPSPLVVGPIDGESEYYFPNKLVETKLMERLMEDIVCS